VAKVELTVVLTLADGREVAEYLVSVVFVAAVVFVENAVPRNAASVEFDVVLLFVDS